MPEGSIYGIPIVVVGSVLVLVAILWFFLPFAVFGIQSKLEKILMEIRHTNALLNRIARDTTAPDAEPRDEPARLAVPPDDRL